MLIASNRQRDSTIKPQTHIHRGEAEVIMEKPKEPNPFNEPEPSTFKFRVSCELRTDFGLEFISKEIETHLANKFGLSKDKASVSEIQWFKDRGKSYVEVSVGYIQTDKSMTDLEKTVHVALQDENEVVQAVSYVNCIDIIP